MHMNGKLLVFFVAAAALLGCAAKQNTTRPPAPPAAAAASVAAADPAVAPTTAPARSFGQPMADGDALPTVDVSTLLKDPGAYAGKPLRITGTVRQVCAKKGCWLTLGDADQAKGLFVKFTRPIEGRLIPAEAIGKPAAVQGEVRVTQMSEAQARHYKKDAGATQEEIERIVGPQKRVIVASPAAQIVGLAEAPAAPTQQ